jgi:acyl-coenzyme A synthetase/AMP-(fatty) acid ligase
LDAALKSFGQPDLPVLCVHRPELNPKTPKAGQALVPTPSQWPSNYRDYAVLMDKYKGRRAAVAQMDATDPLYVLYTSGMTRFDC